MTNAVYFRITSARLTVAFTCSQPLFCYNTQGPILFYSSPQSRSYITSMTRTHIIYYYVKLHKCLYYYVYHVFVLKTKSCHQSHLFKRQPYARAHTRTRARARTRTHALAHAHSCTVTHTQERIQTLTQKWSIRRQTGRVCEPTHSRIHNDKSYGVYYREKHIGH